MRQETHLVKIGYEFFYCGPGLSDRVAPYGRFRRHSRVAREQHADDRTERFPHELRTL